MKGIKRRDIFRGLWLWAGLGVCAQGAERVVGFEDVSLEAPALVAYTGPGGGGYYNGSDGTGGFTSGGVFFPNDYNPDYASWVGWAYSTTTDVETAGWGNQYSAYAGGAAQGQVYAVTYAPSSVQLPAGWQAPQSVQVTNTTYAAISMRDGDDFAKQFGPGDWFRLTIQGRDARGEERGRVEIYLADFREGTAPGYILDSWENVDLTPLGTGVSELAFLLESTDNAAWGMNTPSYVAVDDLVLAETPTWAGYPKRADGWVDTGPFLGWVHVSGDYLYVLSLGRYVYLPEEGVDAGGAWAYMSR